MPRYNQIDDVDYLKFCLWTLQQIDTRFGERPASDGQPYTPPSPEELQAMMYANDDPGEARPAHVTEWRLF